jgi:hypothetical protein
MFIANTTSGGTTMSTPTLPTFELSNTKPSAGAASHTDADSLSLTIVFGVLGLLVAVVGISIAVLQFRHTLRRAKTIEIFELACRAETLPVVERYTDLFLEPLGWDTKPREMWSRATLNGQSAGVLDPVTMLHSAGDLTRVRIGIVQGVLVIGVAERRANIVVMYKALGCL